MKEFFNQYKKIFIIVLIIFLVAAIGAGIYFFVLDDRDADVDESNGDNIAQETTPQDSANANVSELPDYDERSSSEAIEATNSAAKEWSSDAKLYKCQGVTTSAVFPDIVYDFVGADNGNYYRWNCTYYSASKAEIKIFGYVEGELESDTQAMDIGEFGDLLYGDVDYPNDPTTLVDSGDIYTSVVSEGLDETNNYVNMYLGDTGAFGYVWKVDERSKEDQNEYEVGIIQNVYIYNANTGQLIDVVQEEVN
jgi:hypothetical protein